MRLYSIVNMYLSDIQKGIQTAHIVGELANAENNTDFQDWSTSHKTIIVLNGGYSENIKGFADLVGKSTLQGVAFSESEAALGGALTATGLIVPERFYILGQYAKQGLVDTKLLEDGTEGAEPTYIATIKEDVAVGLTDDDREKLTEQLKRFGEYTEADVVLINTLNNFRLA